MTKHWQSSSPHALFILICAGIAVSLWYFKPGLGWLPLIVGLLPWGVRLFAWRETPIILTPIDGLLIMFLVTAVIGIWTAYDRSAAWSKFWLIVGAVVLFYALAAQPRAHLWLLAGLMGGFSVIVASYFLFTHDWNLIPAKTAVLNQVALRWMAMRPSITAHQLHPNVAGGIVAMLFPLLVALGLWTAKGKRWGLTLVVVIGGVIALSGLLFTTSRGAWVALLAGLGLWLLWRLSARLAQSMSLSSNMLFGAALVGICGLTLLLLLSYPGGPMVLVERLPGPANTTSRSELIHDTLDLIGDFPFTGGGLGAFPGLYAQYILIIPFFSLIHSHNLFLNIALEQGLVGLILFGSILGITIWLLLTPPARENELLAGESLIRGVLLASLTVMLVHGLVDDPLYGSRGVLLLFLLPGTAVALAAQKRILIQITQRRLVGMAVFSGCMFIFVLFNLKPLLASWQANLGAVSMAQIELTGWPPGRWEDGSNVKALDPAKHYFEQALTFNPDERTAHQRLGTIAMQRRDFAQAIVHLEAAYQANPQHKGIRKILGYSYAWSGELESALDILIHVPEAADEMNVYTWWWGTQGRDDLAAQSAVFLTRLNENLENHETQ